MRFSVLTRTRWTDGEVEAGVEVLFFSKALEWESYVV